MMNSPNLTTVPLPPTNGRSIGDDSRRPASRGMLREPGHRIKTGENSRPTNGEYSTPAHSSRERRAALRSEHEGRLRLLLALELAQCPKLSAAKGVDGR